MDYKTAIRRYKKSRIIPENIFNDNFINLQLTEETQEVKIEEVNQFDELNKISCQYVDDDYMTGYYFATYLVPVMKEITSFHFGCNNIIDGFSKVLNLNWYGSDLNNKDRYKNHYIKGGSSCDGDISNINTIRSIVNELSSMEKINIYICDINPKTSTQLYNSLIIPLTARSSKCLNIIRLPKTWDNKFANFIYVILHFSMVKIFITPWNGKKYIIFQGNNLSNAFIKSYIKYCEKNMSGEQDLLFHSDIQANVKFNLYKIIQKVNSFIIDEETNENNVKKYYEKIKNNEKNNR